MRGVAREPVAIPGEQPGRGMPPRGGSGGRASRKFCLLTGPECSPPSGGPQDPPPLPEQWALPWFSRQELKTRRKAAFLFPGKAPSPGQPPRTCFLGTEELPLGPAGIMVPWLREVGGELLEKRYT